MDLQNVLYGILSVGAIGIACFTVKYLKEISENLQAINIKMAVMIEKHDSLEYDHKELKKEVQSLRNKFKSDVPKW